VDSRDARPAKSLAANSDPIAQGASPLLDEIKKVFRCIDEDGARRLPCGV
jgi:hypothetical protein